MADREPENESNNAETLSSEYVLNQLKDILAKIDFESLSDTEIYFATLIITTWILETFGRKGYNSSVWRIDPDRDNKIKGNNLPEKLKNLVMYYTRNRLGEELGFRGGNIVWLNTKQGETWVNTPIPRGDELKEIPSLQEKIEFLKANPDIIQNIEPIHKEVWPEIQIVYTPDHPCWWGIEITVSPFGITALPFGELGETKDPTDFVLNTTGQPAVLARVACELAYLEAKHTSYLPDSLPNNVIEKLRERLAGEETL